MKFVWDDDKNRINQAKHRISFELACEVFDDPLARTLPDPSEEEERWRTMGMVGNVVMVLVIHTFVQAEGANEETIRLISARKATPQERRAYEEEAE